MANLTSEFMLNLTMLNSSEDQFDFSLADNYARNRDIDDPAYGILIALYSALILIGALGNTLVVAAVVRNASMRTARNMFIVNLAISDLLLCTITMPLTLVEILTKYWPLGSDDTLCKMIGTLQATSVFVSTISIIAIAFDRYQVIVYPTRDNLQMTGVITTLVVIWSLALLLACPLFFVKQLHHYNIDFSRLGYENFNEIAFCIEAWPMENGRAYYSAFALCVQYVMPIIVVSIAYAQIYFKLKTHGVMPGDALKNTIRKIERGQRMRRTNCLLISIAVIFGVSWLPLNIFNLYADIYMAKDPMTQEHLIVYAVCHMMGMSSACSNPLLYGWLNENFRKEFNEILCRPEANAAGYNSNRKGFRTEITRLELNESGKGRRMVNSGITETGANTELTVLVR